MSQNLSYITEAFAAQSVPVHSLPPPYLTTVGSESHAAGSDQGTITVGHAALSSAVVMAALDPESLPEEPLDSTGFWLTVNWGP